MTGFGVAQAELDGVLVGVEVRSVNNRHFKCTLRIPEDFTALEPELEAVATRLLVRGSVIVTVRISNAASRIAARIDGARLKDYINQIEIALGSLAEVSGTLAIVREKRFTKRIMRIDAGMRRLLGPGGCGGPTGACGVPKRTQKQQ